MLCNVREIVEKHKTLIATAGITGFGFCLYKCK